MAERNSDRIFRDMPAAQAVARLAVPTVLGQIILVIYNMADTFFIGMAGSDVKITAVTVCMPAFMFLSAVSNLFGVGAEAVISRSLGSGHRNRAMAASSFAFWGCITVTLLYSLGARLLLDPYINILGGRNPAVHSYACTYLLITVVFGGVAASMNALLAALFRAEGRSLTASVGVAAGGLLNIVLDPLFMFVLLPEGNEVTGAALATALSNFISVVYFLILLRSIRNHTVISLGIRSGQYSWSVIRSVLSAGFPACMMTLLENISYAVLDNLMADCGTQAQAGLGVAKKVNMLAHCMVRGVTQGVLPLLAYNFAARNYERMRSALKTSMLTSVVLASLCLTANMIFARQLIGIFINHGGDSLYFGARFLRILCVGGPFSACAYALISFFQAVGRGSDSFLLVILRKGILDIPLMFVFRHRIPLYGIVLATPVTDVLCCFTAVLLYLHFLRSVQRKELIIEDN
ncbi:MAG: hypothetical protein IKF51_08450 [Solobacterium sp.]|nr:hypothetical protein [Solobacterium sp.]